MDDIHEEILTLKKLYGVAFDYEGIILALRIARYSKYPILGGEKETFFFVLEEACERKDLNTDDYFAFALHDDERIQLHDKFMERSNVIGVTEIAEMGTELTGIPSSWFVKLKDSIINSLLVPKVDSNSSGRPLGLFLFVGSNGGYKYKLAEANANELYDEEDNCPIRIDMEKYTDPDSASCLVGTFVNTLKNKPYSVVILDKIDKAHSSAMDALVSALNPEKGIDFRNVLIILTCYIEDEDMYELSHASGLGKEYEEATTFVKPELLQVVDEMILIN